MASSAPKKNKKVLLLRQKFESSSSTTSTSSPKPSGHQAGNKLITRGASHGELGRPCRKAEVHVPGLSRQCRPGGSERVCLSTADGSNDGSPRSRTGKLEQPTDPPANGKVAHLIESKKEAARPRAHLQNVQVSTSNQTATKPVGVTKQGQGQKWPSKRNTTNDTCIGDEQSNMRALKPAKMKGKGTAQDPEARIASPQPEETKPPSIAERAQNFLAEEPNSGRNYQHRQQAGEAGVQLGLATHLWESGDQADDEEDLVDDRHKKRAGFESQSDKEVVSHPSRRNDSSSGRLPQSETKNLPSSGFHKIIPKWFWKNRRWFKSSSGSHKKDLQSVAKYSDSSSHEESEVYENLHPVEKPNVNLCDTTTIHVSECTKVTGCQVHASDQQVVEDSLSPDGSSHGWSNSEDSPQMGQHSNHCYGEDSPGLLPQDKLSKLLKDASGQDSSCKNNIEMNSYLAVTKSDKLSVKTRKASKPLPDIPIDHEVTKLAAHLVEKPLIIASNQDHLKLGLKKDPKHVIDAHTEGSPASDIQEELDQSTQVCHKGRNDSMSSKTQKPLPKAPARDFPLKSVCSRQEQSSTRTAPQPAKRIFTPTVFVETEKATPTCQGESSSSDPCNKKVDKTCFSAPESADVSHPPQTQCLKMAKPLPKVRQNIEDSILTRGTFRNGNKLSASEKTEGCYPLKINHSNSREPQTKNPLPDVPQSMDTTEVQKTFKPLRITCHHTRQPAVTLINENLSKALPVVLEEEESATVKPVPGVPRHRSQCIINSGPGLMTSSSASFTPEEATLQEIQNMPKTRDTSADADTQPANFDHPDEIIELIPEEHSIHVPGSDKEDGSIPSMVFPLWENKLNAPQDDAWRLRRTSSLDEVPKVALSFTNAQGLFHLARQQMKSCESLDTPSKPPIAQKPHIFKKPSPSDGPGSVSNKPGTAPKLTSDSPPRTPPKPNRYSPPSSRRPTMDNIYDEVYRDQSQAESDPSSNPRRTNSKKVQQLLGPEYHEEDNGQGKAFTVKQHVNTNERKISGQTGDKEGPYAVIPLPDVDKTATKKTKNPAEQKTRKISDGNGKEVVLRNSEGMSSGDSGIVPLHDRACNEKIGMSRIERRMSRRLLRKKMKSIDSDFIEDSDDEPIGVDSDFDSDTSLEEPSVFMDDSHKKAFEVLTTERTYVETLHLINQVFLAQIQAENQKHHWFPQTVLNEIFSNVTSIYQLHSAVLLPELEKRLKEWDSNPSLGAALKTVAPFLKLYSDYVSNFDHAMKQLNLWTSKVPKFAAALLEMQKHPLCRNLTLQHHMLTPIQRIPRYELLLKEYLKKLPDDAADKEDTDKALTIISGAAQHSNDMMERMEQFEKLLKINEKIDGENIIDPTRHLLKEGKITKIAAKNKEPQDRYLFLFNDILLCCEKKRLLTSANYKVKVKLEVDGMKVLDSFSCRFIIEGKSKSIEFQTNSEEEREEWMRVLLSAIREMVWKKESFKMNDAVADKQNGYDDKFIPGKNDPIWIKDDETTMCMRCGTDFKLTKRRHHCRSCGSVVCSKCSNFEAPLEYDDNKMNKVCVKCYYLAKGDDEELQRLARRSLIVDLDENNSFGSHLYLHHKGAWTKFWVVVTEQDLFALKAPKDVRPVVTLPIKMYSVRDLPDSDAERDHVFRLSSGRTVYTLSAESKEFKRKWMAVLTQGIDQASRRSLTL